MPCLVLYSMSKDENHSSLVIYKALWDSSATKDSADRNKASEDEEIVSNCFPSKYRALAV